MKKSRVNKASQKRISAKIEHLVKSGEKPNTPEGRKEAAGMAYGMERAHRLKAGGGYKKVKKGKK